MRRKPVLTTDDVHTMVAACKAKGAEKDRRPTIAIVDDAGHLLYLERPDCNGVNTVEMSIAKAKTAAYRGRPSRAFGERIKERPQFLMSPNYLGVEGGIPILFEGACLGGVGVSGIDHDDEPVAIAGAQAFKP
ncbi:MAG: heme-binding protein [Hyphomicrobiales bacterium]|nr:heme-binding protein [Hyphomicrobiales bacterium]